jgi:3-deoxy-D-manno-octulosonic-acid transferase
MIYDLAISFYGLAINIAALFKKKARLLKVGREHTFKQLAHFNRDPLKKLAWFHCASLGEFEQARPLIEKLKAQHNIQIAVSFFSPSGYEIRKNYELADVVFYLPADTPKNANFVLNALTPDLVFFVKYEIWLHYIKAVTKRSIPMYLISATFRPNQIYFRWYGAAFKRALKSFDLIFTQDQTSTQTLQTNGVTNVLLSNDTRYDRVYETCQNPKPLPIIEAFKQQQRLLVVGSSYAQEERLVEGFLKEDKNLKIVIAPHEISEERIGEVERTFKNFSTITYSVADEVSVRNKQILIIDNIGLLASIYQYGDVALVGGGFGKKGIHNTLEAATFGMPIFIGPNNHDKFPEIKLLHGAGVLFYISTQEEFDVKLLSFTTNTSLLHDVKQNSSKVMASHRGATQLILDKLRM